MWEKTTLLLLLCLPLAGMADCLDAAWLVVEQRSDQQVERDEAKQRLRCVVFVVEQRRGEIYQGWVEWHSMKRGRWQPDYRFGLYADGDDFSTGFGRVPDAVVTPSSAVAMVVLLPGLHWTLVNTTRTGWKWRSGLLDEGGQASLRKLFTDVGLNAGLNNDDDEAGTEAVTLFESRYGDLFDFGR